MPDYKRPASLPGIQKRNQQRLADLIQRAQGTLTFYDSGTYGVVNNDVVWSDTITVAEGGIIEFWASVVISHSTVSTTELTVDVDGTSSFKFASKATSGTLRIGTNPGVNTGTSGSTQPPAFIVIGWNLDPGPHTVSVTTTRPVTGGTSQLTDQNYAIRQA
jgi:hypothetical protein